MPRFLIRSRLGATHNHDRPTKSISPSRSTSSAAASRHSSCLVQYETLPTRHPNGQALNYSTYTPSRYYVPFAHGKTRRPRQTTISMPAAPRDGTAHLHLYFDSEPSPNQSQRSCSHNADENGAPAQFSRSKPETHSVHHAIRLKAAALRRYLARAAELGDLTVLKQVVSNHRDALARVRRARHAALVRLHDATTLTGLPPPTTAVAPPVHGAYRRPTPIRANAIPANTPGVTRVRPLVNPTPDSTVRRVPGPPGRRGARARSSLRGRRAASVSHEDDIPSPDTFSPADPTDSMNPLSQTLPGPPNRRRYVGRLSRKSSGTLRRLSSAGSMLIRRLSRGSVGGNEHNSTGSVPHDGVSPAVAAATGVVSATLDRSTLARLKTEPADVVAELELDAKRLHAEERDALTRLKTAERVLEERRDFHDKAMAILDQFYGSLPGWQQDPITQAMFLETVDMTDAGLETERDLAEARHNLTQAHAALKDHGLALSSLQSITEELGVFISGLDRLVRSIADCESHSNTTDAYAIRTFDGELCTALRQLEKHLDKCVNSAEMAAECCVDAPRVRQMERDLRTMRNGFASKVKAVMSMGPVHQKDLSEQLHLAKAAVCDCKLAETFVKERERMVSEDAESFEESVERCEEYVMQERMALVDLHHPCDDDN